MSYSCSVPILMIFFNRPDSFAQVFEKVREARPKTLILAQDGPRNSSDIAGVEACRKIVENIDWDCNVIKNYSEVNLGCGMRPKSAIDFAFKQFEQIIILEDDCIPASTFFPYCEELLEKYKDDDRIAYISGLNHFETWDCGNYDYFFSRAAAIWGWATWRKKWCRFYDYHVNGINDPYIRKLYSQQIGDKYAYEIRLFALIKANRAAKNDEKLSYWDTQWGFAEYTQNMLAIVPRKNQICNIGAGKGSTHAKYVISRKYKKHKNIMFIPTYDLEFPLKHPKFCACDMDYHNLVYRCSRGNIIKRVIKKFLNVQKLIE